MAYLRCTECGSKALVAASQCPRCAHPFNLHDARGQRVKLARCRGCGIMHRQDVACHWCGPRKPSFHVTPQVWRSAAAVALMITGVGAVWRVGPSVRAFTTTLVNDARLSSRAEVALPVTRVSMATPVAVAPSYAVTDSMPTAAVTSDSLAGEVAVLPDSVQWTPAVARTWVNVRSDASRGGEVVGVIKPASRAMLGTDRAGWRQVRSPDITGWVDPRLFEADSLRTRGE
jgi:hypothetical protein